MKDLLKLFSLGFRVADGVTKHHLGAYAAQAAFFTVLSFFPFLMSIMSLVQFVPIPNEQIKDLIISFIPEAFYSYIEPLIMDTLDNSTGTVLSLSILVTLWAASKGVMSIKNGFNTITNYRKSTNYFVVRLISTIYTLFFSFSIILLMVALVFGNQILHTLMKEFPFIAGIANTIGSLRTIVVIALLLLFFLFFYRFLPDQKTTFLHCIPGALLSTIGWVGTSLGFSIYIDNFNNFTVMYGSLTGIILTLLWLYFCMFILFIGGELNHCLFGVPENDISYLPL